ESRFRYIHWRRRERDHCRGQHYEKKARHNNPAIFADHLPVVPQMQRFSRQDRNSVRQVLLSNTRRRREGIRSEIFHASLLIDGDTASNVKDGGEETRNSVRDHFSSGRSNLYHVPFLNTGIFLFSILNFFQISKIERPHSVFFCPQDLHHI